MIVKEDSLDTLISLKVFRQVVESSGFTAAAAVLDLSVAMVSKHVQHLESQLGSRLLHRTSRKVSLTSQGALYFERCCEILNGLEEAESELRCTMQRPRGKLRISAPSWFGSRFFAKLLRGYREQYPEVELDISLSDAMVDWVADGLDIALRVTRATDAPKARRLGTIHFVLLASKAYLELRGRPASLKDLAEHELIQYAYAPPHFLMGKSSWRCDNTNLIGQLAAEGAGVAFLPKVLFEQESYAAELEEVLPGILDPSPDLYAITHEKRHPSLKVSSFLDYAAQTFSRPAC